MTAVPSPTSDRTLRLYLAGKVAKQKEDRSGTDWRAGWRSVLDRFGKFDYLDPDAAIDESRPEIVFGHDCYLVKSCDVVIVDARTKLGAGTAQEMVIAKHFGKTVLTVLPPDSHHRKTIDAHGTLVEDWHHPFVACTSDELFDSIEDLGRWLGAAGHWSLRAKSLSVVEEAISAYLRDGQDSERLAAA